MNTSVAIFISDQIDHATIKSYKDFFTAEGSDSVFVIGDNPIDAPKDIGVNIISMLRAQTKKRRFATVVSETSKQSR